MFCCLGLPFCSNIWINGVLLCGPLGAAAVWFRQRGASSLFSSHSAGFLWWAVFLLLEHPFHSGSCEDALLCFVSHLATRYISVSSEILLPTKFVKGHKAYSKMFYPSCDFGHNWLFILLSLSESSISVSWNACCHLTRWWVQQFVTVHRGGGVH